MDMSSHTEPTKQPSKLQQHVDALRRNKLTIGHIFLFLSEDPPNASAAREALGELSEKDQIAIWSISTKDGGVWETWERDALKYGDLELTGSWWTWCARRGL
jgi:hypothetical protein